MNQKQIENRALIVTTIVNAIITAAGIWMYFLTDLQVMFLDGFFSLIALASTIVAVLISKLSKRTTKSYPHGLYYLEPLYAVIKSVTMIVLMVVALVEAGQVAIAYFVHGKGEVMNTAPLPYSAWDWHFSTADSIRKRIAQARCFAPNRRQILLTVCNRQVLVLLS